MIKLLGLVDGVEVRFDFHPPNRFNAVIPKHLTGKYILCLIAIDEAGNESAYTDTYIFVDFNQMDFKLLANKYAFNMRRDNIRYIKLNGDFDASIFDSDWSYQVLGPQYTFKELIII